MCMCARGWKLQILSSKLQRNTKLQSIKRKSSRFRATTPAANVEKASDRFCDLKFGASLELGVWVLEFFTQPQIDHLALMSAMQEKENPSRFAPGGAWTGFCFTLSSVVLRFCSLNQSRACSRSRRDGHDAIELLRVVPCRRDVTHGFARARDRISDVLPAAHE
jgi:hypothetical protein